MTAWASRTTASHAGSAWPGAANAACIRCTRPASLVTVPAVSAHAAAGSAIFAVAAAPRSCVVIAMTSSSAIRPGASPVSSLPSMTRQRTSPASSATGRLARPSASQISWTPRRLGLTSATRSRPSARDGTSGRAAT